VSDGPQCFVVGGQSRPRGRPRVDEPRSVISTRVRPKHHDLLVRLADERSTSVSAVMRSLVESACRAIERKREGA
jgi:hypothetical protein